MLKLTKTYDVCKAEKSVLTAVFIHGVAASSKSFDGLFKYLTDNNDVNNIRIVAFDLLGAGESYASDELEYNYDEQIEALYNSIKELGIKGPLVLVGHSMGTMIATRFANTHPQMVDGLILISAPVYRKEDILDPRFKKAMDGFREVVAVKDKTILNTKAFNNEIDSIVSNVENYEYLLRLNKPTVIIYGELDRIIASFNIPGLLKQNKSISAIKTAGAHGVSKDKYHKIVSVLNSFSEEGEK